MRLNLEQLPSLEEAGVIALNILENVVPIPIEKEQAFFIAGFKECIKWLNNNELNIKNINMKVLDLLKGKTINYKTDALVVVQLVIKSAEIKNYSVDLEPATAKNDWWPASRDWTKVLVTFTNGFTHEFDNIESIDIVD
jgi:hypothetical protein